MNSTLGPLQSSFLRTTGHGGAGAPFAAAGVVRAAPPDVRAAGASLACVCAALPCRKKRAVSAPVRHGEIHEEIHERTGADWARAELGGETLAPAVLPSESKTKRDEHSERKPRWGRLARATHVLW